MRLLNINKLVGVAALGLALIAGVSDASAQGRGNGRNLQRAIKQQQKVQKEQLKLQQERLRLERMRLQAMQSRDRYRVRTHNGGWYNTNRRGTELLQQAVNEGYRQGLAAGRNDRNRRVSLNWSSSNIYRTGTYGYQTYVDRSQYQYYFRQGFERGYQDGYNSRYQYGTNNNGVVNILGTILGSILNVQQY